MQSISGSNIRQTSCHLEKVASFQPIGRINWLWGKSKINVITLAIAYEGMAIPILWRALNKPDNASAQEHIDITKRFVDIFGTDCIAGVLDDYNGCACS